MKSPNILFLMTDQQRWDAMGCSGDWIETPNLDRIASEGTTIYELCHDIAGLYPDAAQPGDGFVSTQYGCLG